MPINAYTIKKHKYFILIMGEIIFVGKEECNKIKKA